MIRWFLVTLLALVIFSGLQSWLQKLGFGRLPGDLNFRLFGRHWQLPITSTLILSMIAAALAKWL
jgi:ribose/xylose/arabinose/galactoside ABC-type transport system permease subunit